MPSTGQARKSRARSARSQRLLPSPGASPPSPSSPFPGTPSPTRRSLGPAAPRGRCLCPPGQRSPGPGPASALQPQCHGGRPGRGTHLPSLASCARLSSVMTCGRSARRCRSPSASFIPTPIPRPPPPRTGTTALPLEPDPAPPPPGLAHHPGPRPSPRATLFIPATPHSGPRARSHGSLQPPGSRKRLQIPLDCDTCLGFARSYFLP